MKKLHLAILATLLSMLSAVPLVIGSPSTVSTVNCDGDWCFVYTPFGREHFCCPSGDCPDPYGAPDCQNESQ